MDCPKCSGTEMINRFKQEKDTLRHLTICKSCGEVVKTEIKAYETKRLPGRVINTKGI